MHWWKHTWMWRSCSNGIILIHMQIDTFVNLLLRTSMEKLMILLKKSFNASELQFHKRVSRQRSMKASRVVFARRSSLMNMLCSVAIKITCLSQLLLNNGKRKVKPVYNKKKIKKGTKQLVTKSDVWQVCQSIVFRHDLMAVRWPANGGKTPSAIMEPLSRNKPSGELVRLAWLHLDIIMLLAWQPIFFPGT